MSRGDTTSGDGAQPPAIPYEGTVEGPMRRLELVLRRSPTLTVKPSVAIDSQFHDVDWGRVAFEVPADRTVRVEAWIFLTRQMGWASYALEQGGPATLEYVAPAAARYGGRLGPLGTVKRQGRVYLAFMIVFFVAAMIPLLGILALVIAALIR
jgi:hypothetical protein